MKYNHFRYKLTGIVQKHLSIESDVLIGHDTDLVKDLGADNLDMIELIMAVEENFDIEISDDLISEIETFGILCDKIYDIVSV